MFLLFLLINCHFAYALGQWSPVLSLWEGTQYENLNTPALGANPHAPKGGTVRLTAVGGFDNFSFFSTKGTRSFYVGLTVETLGEAIPGTYGILRGRLAQSFVLSDDRKTLRVKIHPLAAFSDGSKVTAKDVIFSINARTNSNPYFKLLGDMITEMEAESEQIIRFTFSPEVGREIPLSVCTMPIVQAAWWIGKDTSEPQKNPFIGSGPYFFGEYELGKRVELIRNPQYWAKDLEHKKGLYNFDRLIVDYFRDITVAREVFFAKEAYAFTETTMKDWENAYDVPQVQSGDIVRGSSRVDSYEGTGIAMNLRNPILQDKNVRNALILLMDFEYLNKKLYYNSYERVEEAFSIYGKNLTEKPTSQELELLHSLQARFGQESIDKAVFGPLPHLPINDGTGQVRARMIEAVELLEKAGWYLQEGRIVNKNGKQMVLRFPVSSQTVQRTFASYERLLQRVGIDCQIQLLDQNQYKAMKQTRDFDLSYEEMPTNAKPSSTLSAYWSSERADDFSSRNAVGLKDPVVDALIDVILTSENFDTITLYSKVLDRILRHGMYYIHGWHSPHRRIAWWKDMVQPGVAGNTADVFTMSTWHMAK